MLPAIDMTLAAGDKTCFALVDFRARTKIFYNEGFAARDG